MVCCCQFLSFLLVSQALNKNKIQCSVTATTAAVEQIVKSSKQFPSFMSQALTNLPKFY
jgi:hypothetical protein